MKAAGFIAQKPCGRSTGWAIRHTSKVVHRLLIAATGLLVVALLLLAGAAWRLAQGPIDLGWLSDRVRAALIDDAARCGCHSKVWRWRGRDFNKGVDYPLDFRVSSIAVTDPAGTLDRRRAQRPLTVSFAGLVLGRFVPRAIEVDHARIAGHKGCRRRDQPRAA